MGHAGAIVSGGDSPAKAKKMKMLDECGISVAESVADIGITMKKEIEKRILMKNKTFAILKPDAVKNGHTGKIYDRIL